MNSYDRSLQFYMRQISILHRKDSCYSFVLLFSIFIRFLWFFWFLRLFRLFWFLRHFLMFFRFNLCFYIDFLLWIFLLASSSVVFILFTLSTILITARNNRKLINEANQRMKLSNEYYSIFFSNSLTLMTLFSTSYVHFWQWLDWSYRGYRTAMNNIRHSFSKIPKIIFMFSENSPANNKSSSNSTYIRTAQITFRIVHLSVATLQLRT